MIFMDDISIDVIKEIGEYDNVFSEILRVKGAERIHEEVLAYMRDSGEKNSERIHEWRRMYLDIARLKEKINEQHKEIRTRVASYSISNDEYNEIIADTDLQKQHTHLKRFLEERVGEIESTLLASGNFDKQVCSLNEPDEMLEMRKNAYIDRKNITEALSVVLFEDMKTKRIFWSLLDGKAGTFHTRPNSQMDQQTEVIFEESLKEMAHVLSLIEQYQRRGLQEIRRLEEFDRQIVYMLTALALKKHP